jgi:hypothetical protein
MILRRLTIPVRIFIVFTAIYLATWGGHYTYGDGAFKVDCAKTILLHK